MDELRKHPNVDAQRLAQWEAASRLPSVVKRYLTLKARVDYLVRFMDDDVAAAELSPLLVAAETELKRLTDWQPPEPEPLSADEQRAVNVVMGGLRRYFPSQTVESTRAPDIGRNVLLVIHAGADLLAAYEAFDRFESEWWAEQGEDLRDLITVHLR